MRRDEWTKALVLAAAGILVALAAVILLQRPFRVGTPDVAAAPSADISSHPRGGSGAETASADAPARPPGPARPAEPPGAATSPAKEIDAELGEVTVVSLTRRTVEDYRNRAQYPRFSQPLQQGEDPILRDRQISPVTARGPSGEDPTLTVFPEQIAFESPDPILLYAYLSIGDERVAARAIVGSIMTESLQPLVDLTYGDEGGAGDAVAADRVYTALFQPEPGQMSALSESFLVRVSAFPEEGEEIRAATSFQYSNPDAQLTGSYRDRLEDGSLVVEAEIEVRNPGRFHLEGTLYGTDGREPIVWAQDAADLAPGRHWLRLTFFGRILNQRAIDGPYLLRFLALSTATQMPNAKNRLVENAHRTAAYAASGFSDAPFDDPDLLEAANRLERDLAPAGLDGGG